MLMFFEQKKTFFFLTRQLANAPHCVSGKGSLFKVRLFILFETPLGRPYLTSSHAPPKIEKGATVVTKQLIYQNWRVKNLVQLCIETYQLHLHGRKFLAI